MSVRQVAKMVFFLSFTHRKTQTAVYILPVRPAILSVREQKYRYIFSLYISDLRRTASLLLRRWRGNQTA